MPINKLHQLREKLTNSVLGSEDSSSMLLTALLAGGHVLIEGAPGLGKTSLAQSLASGIGGDFKRVQFTPDLLPSDIIGYHLFKQVSGEFDFIPGPVFTNLLLADEINRTSPRVQSALLEAMNDRQVTIDGVSHQLAKPFMVVATQNNTTTTGTFPLPEPQLDRFLVSIQMQLPDESIQVDILNAQLKTESKAAEAISLLDTEEVESLQQEVARLPVSETINQYIIRLCEKTRHSAGGSHTVSVRASLALMRAAQAYAFLDEKEVVHPDHVQAMFIAVMNHRLVLEDASPSLPVLQAVLEDTLVP